MVVVGVVVVGVDDDIGDLLLTELAGVVDAPIAELFDCEMTLLLFVVAICCCCFGLLEPDVGVVGIDTVGVVDGDRVVDTGVAAAVGSFNVFGILHMRASVVLTTLRLGLLGSHISDF
jgi:hypothetical protein